MSAPSVNHALTPDTRNGITLARHPRPRRAVVENDDYAGFTRRILAAHGRRIAQGDIEGLTTLAHLATEVDTAIHTAITGLRRAGHSWADVAARLGITRQAAHQRWGGDRP